MDDVSPPSEANAAVGEMTPISTKVKQAQIARTTAICEFVMTLREAIRTPTWDADVHLHDARPPFPGDLRWFSARLSFPAAHSITERRVLDLIVVLG